MNTTGNWKYAALILGALAILAAVVSLSYMTGHSDAQRGVAAAPAVAPAPTVEDVVAGIPDTAIQDVCPGWRVYRGTTYESVLKSALLNGLHSTGSPMPFSDDAIWLAVRDRLERDCVIVNYY